MCPLQLHGQCEVQFVSRPKDQARKISNAGLKEENKVASEFLFHGCAELLRLSPLPWGHFHWGRRLPLKSSDYRGHEITARQRGSQLGSRLEK